MQWFSNGEEQPCGLCLVHLHPQKLLNRKSFVMYFLALTNFTHVDGHKFTLVVEFFQGSQGDSSNRQEKYRGGC